jgi:hypothetical protein
MRHLFDTTFATVRWGRRGDLSFGHGILVFLIGVLWATVAGADGRPAASPDGPVRPGSGYDYIVEKGDTLWDLSRRFAGSPFHWPRVWQHNNQIPNPHRIFPGDRIRLSPSTGRPSTAVSFLEESTRMSEAQASQAPSAPASFRYAAIESVGFVRRRPVVPTATVSVLPDDKTIAGQWDALWVRPAEGTTLLPGQQFICYRVLAPIVDEADKKLVGYPHYLLGVVEVVAVAGESVKAEIVRSFREVRLGDKLMPRPMPPPDADIALAAAPPDLAGKILQSEAGMVFLGDYSVAFINRGRRDGVAVGQRYKIGDPTLPVDHLETGLSPAVGDLLVLRVEEATATALVTGARREIPPGAAIISGGLAQ